MDYPINVYVSSYSEDVAERHKRISDLSRGHDWPKLIEEIKNRNRVNACKLREETSNEPADLYTPLHHAAEGKAPKEVIKELLDLRASRTLKTANGETAYDIAKRQGLGEEILKLLEIPPEVMEIRDKIEKMEAGLHKVILGRVEVLITKHGQALPQLGYLYEFGEFHYPVPEMYGGFNVSKHDKGIEVTSFIRIVGGSGQRHVINKKGKVKLKQKGFY